MIVYHWVSALVCVRWTAFLNFCTAPLSFDCAIPLLVQCCSMRFISSRVSLAKNIARV